MTVGLKTTLLGSMLLLSVPGVAAAAESTGVIIASVVAGVLLVLLILGVAIFCYYKHKTFDDNHNTKRPRNKKHQVYVANGYHASAPHRHEKRRVYESNGYAQPVPMMTQLPPPPQPAYNETTRMPPGPVPYATYHGPPPEMDRQKEMNGKAGTLSGPPTIFIPYKGTMTIRADPRPVVHKSSNAKEPTSEDRHRSTSRHRSPTRQQTRPPTQEFVVQQSYDGVPVIRPVIYVDDDDDRKRHRSKSREHRYKKKTPPPGGAKITEITDENTRVSNVQSRTDVVIEHMPQRSRSKTPPRSPVLLRAPSPEPKQDDRSRASSVTEAVNALRMSVRDHLDDNVSTSSHDSSNAPSFAWTKSHHHHGDDRRAPDPVAGDVMFLPAGTVPETKQPKPEPEPKQQTPDDVIYSYTKVIKPSPKDRTPSPPPTRESPVPIPGPRPHVNQGYEVPSSLRRSRPSTREESYETEHGRTTGDYNKIGASMSDRLQNLVEDGDKTRFTHYNLGAMNFADEEKDDEEPVQVRVRRPDTPPLDIPNESHYAQVIKRPRTPPNDIPLVSPRESTEIPPLNLRSTINSPREPSYRPSTPPQDFPITPQSSFIRPRPKTPPTDFPMTPKPSEIFQRPPTPPYDALETTRSVAPADTAKEEVSSFKARQRLIEAHLLKNISPGGPSRSDPTSKPSVPKPSTVPASVHPPPHIPTVHVTPGVIPPAPPPPPPPPPPPVPR